jgi:ribA/ribD-fused uncharacterized protein
MHILIRKVKEPHGWLGNMSPYPIEFNGKRFRTTEALFQAMRFEDEEVIEEIRAEKSPMAAKFVAKRNKERMAIEPCGKKDIENMRECLRLKISQHPELKGLLLATGEEDIVEDCSKRRRGSGLFWGAALEGDVWEGQNWLGTLWTEQRAKLRCSLMAA